LHNVAAFIILKVMVEALKKTGMIQKNDKVFGVLLDDNVLYIVRKICLI